MRVPIHNQTVVFPWVQRKEVRVPIHNHTVVRPWVQREEVRVPNKPELHTQLLLHRVRAPASGQYHLLSLMQYLSIYR